MVVKAKTAPATEPVTPAALGQKLLIQKIHAAMTDHAELAAAREKLRSIESKRSALQAEFDQAQSAVSHPDLSEMAESVLQGRDLGEVDSVVQKRDSLRQKIQAHDLAIQQQRAVVRQAVNAASAGACDLVAPIHRKGVDRLLNAFAEIQSSVAELATINNAMSQNEVMADWRFVYYHMAELQQLCRRMNHMVTSDWNPWLARE